MTNRSDNPKNLSDQEQEINPFEAYMKFSGDDDEHVRQICSNLAAVLQVFQNYQVPKPILLGAFADGSYAETSPFEFGVDLSNKTNCKIIATNLKQKLRTSFTVDVLAIELHLLEDVQYLELLSYDNDPLQLAADLSYRRQRYLEELKTNESSQQVVRVFALHDPTEEKLEMVKTEMREDFQKGPRIRVFATPDGYYSLEGSHRLRASFDLVNETADPIFNPTLITYAATDKVPHDIVNLPNDVSKVEDIVSVHNSSLYYEFKGDISILGHDET